MDMLLFVTIVSAFIAGIAAVFAAVTLSRHFRDSESESRLISFVRGESEFSKKPTLMKESGPSLGDAGNALRSLVSTIVSLNQLFEQAAVSLHIGSFLGISFATGFFALVMAVIFRAPMVFHPLVALFGGLLPLAWLMRRRQVRFARFGKQLPDALQAMARALRAGHSLNAAMTIVANEFLPPVSDEFRRVCSEHSLGRPLEECLDQLAIRIPNEDLAFFATSVRLQQRCGGNLAEILDKICSIVRERYRILGQVHALTGEGRLSGTILLAMPVVLFFTVYYLSPEYVEPLFRDPLGRKLAAGTVILQLLGAIVIRKIVRIKV